LYVGASGTVRLDNGQLTPGGNVVVEGGRIEQTAADSAVLEMPAAGGALRVLAGGEATLVQDLDADGAAIQVDGSGSTLDVAGVVRIGADGAAGTGLVATNQAQIGVTTLDVGSDTAPGDVATAQIGSGASLVADTIRVGSPDAQGTAAAATLEINGGGSRVELTAAGQMTIGANGGLLANAGTVALTDGGVLDTSAGSLELRSSGVLNINGGTLVTAPIAAPQGVLNFSSGTIDWRGDFTVGVGGLLGTQTTLSGNQNLLVAGTTSLDAAAKLTINGGALETGSITGDGVLDFVSGSLRISNDDLAIAAGGLLGSNVAIDGQKHLTVDQTVSVDAAGSLELDGGSLSAGTLANAGQVFYSAGALTVGDTLDNQASGRVLVGSGRNLATGAALNNAGRIELGGGGARLSGPGTFTNTGLLTGSGYVDMPLTNASGGELRAAAGSTLTISGGTAPNAGLINMLGGTIEFAEQMTNAAGGRIAGHGTALFDGGLVNEGVAQFSAQAVDIYGNVTNVAAGQIITSGGGVTTFYDDVVHNGSEIRTSAGSRSVFFGDVSGNGPFTGSGVVQIEGNLSPGNSTAAVTFDGDLSFGAGSTVTMEIGGTSPGSQYDTLLVGGTAMLDGTLLIDLVDGFVPTPSDVFTLMTFGMRAGEFDNVATVTPL
ncbi:MAG: hypothetical protein KDA63_11215, partial [Planctomycetales bacterium]|nr:hypothetical protein [Planctomycetales bacterium]